MQAGANTTPAAAAATVQAEKVVAATEAKAAARAATREAGLLGSAGAAWNKLGSKWKWGIGIGVGVGLYSLMRRRDRY